MRLIVTRQESLGNVFIHSNDVNALSQIKEKKEQKGETIKHTRTNAAT